jgi:hypothetical protein
MSKLSSSHDPSADARRSGSAIREPREYEHPGFRFAHPGYACYIDRSGNVKQGVYEYIVHPAAPGQSPTLTHSVFVEGKLVKVILTVSNRRAMEFGT